MEFWIIHVYSMFMILYHNTECVYEIGNNLVGIGICNRTINDLKQKYCCRNYEQKGNKCEKCKTGYISEGGKKCTHCPGGWDSRYCSYRCECYLNRCNHGVGCSTKSGINNAKPESRPWHDFISSEAFIFFSSGAATILILFGCIFLCKICISHILHKSARGVNMQSSEEIVDRYADHYEMIDESNLRETNTSTVSGVNMNIPNAELLPRLDDVSVDNPSSGEIREEYHNSESELNSYNDLTTEHQSIHLYQRAIHMDP